ncbi:LON peptidase substrate-binding domain-containing protein [Frigidibacter sp. RF13]|uniref:LON peptidase substrate-binding domain-containing protein n=1 Tax=Frigidibacter sp. RF13 TaxID=2997340 RepID=UPI00226E0BCA|nr:LON peptidase substrate-binding domain-containing protein [Frigidibacter sp. RF13]MCY1126567.1 LON peptidase substrate-binding domain-containing protein [Frigidibacter sp. RF13]
MLLKPADLPEVIALFPLPGALLLPRGRLPLHIFEPRYLAMLDDVLKSRERLIGIIQPRPAPEGQRRLSAIGCAGRLTSFNETEDGRYMIALSGISRFRLTREVTGFTPYLRAEISWQGFERDLGQPETDERFDRPAFLDLLRRFFTQKKLATDWEGLEDAPDEVLINALAMLCPFDHEDKQALLEAPTLPLRRETLQMLIEFALRADGEGQLQ